MLLKEESRPICCLWLSPCHLRKCRGEGSECHGSGDSGVQGREPAASISVSTQSCYCSIAEELYLTNPMEPKVLMVWGIYITTVLYGTKLCLFQFLIKHLIRVIIQITLKVASVIDFTFLKIPLFASCCNINMFCLCSLWSAFQFWGLRRLLIFELHCLSLLCCRGTSLIDRICLWLCFPGICNTNSGAQTQIGGLLGACWTCLNMDQRIRDTNWNLQCLLIA